MSGVSSFYIMFQDCETNMENPSEITNNEIENVLSIHKNFKLFYV